MDSETGILRVFKSPEERNPSFTFQLQKGQMNKSESIIHTIIYLAIVWEQKKPLACFEYIIEETKNVLLIVPEIGTSIEALRNAFEFCSKVF